MISNTQRKKILLKQKREYESRQQMLKKTEGRVRFIYPNSVHTNFHVWSSKARDEGIEPTFRMFYETLKSDQKKSITVEYLLQ